jgi:rhodanese-related sulfurtransferase
MNAHASIAPVTLMEAISDGTPPVILDVRTKGEFQRGHVPGAIHVPFWRVSSWRGLEEKRCRPIVLYCGHGPRARIAGAALQRRGVSDVRYLEGHMAKWRDLGLRLRWR